MTLTCESIAITWNSVHQQTLIENSNKVEFDWSNTARHARNYPRVNTTTYFTFLFTRSYWHWPVFPIIKQHCSITQCRAENRANNACPSFYCLKKQLFLLISFCCSACRVVLVSENDYNLIYFMRFKVCKSAVIFTSLVRVWASTDTTLSRTFFILLLLPQLILLEKTIIFTNFFLL